MNKVNTPVINLQPCWANWPQSLSLFSFTFHSFQLTHAPSLPHTLLCHAVFTLALRHFRFRCIDDNDDVDNFSTVVGTIKPAPSIVIRLLTIVTMPEMAYVDGWSVSFASVQFAIVVVFAPLPINPIISCKAKRCSWLRLPVP